MTSPADLRILITPIDTFPDEQLESVAASVQELFGIETEFGGNPIDIEFSLDSERQQYHSTAILEELESQQPTHILKTIALVEVDLFIPILTHVYGEAQLDGKTCIVSSHRLKENLQPVTMEAELTTRIKKEVFHELGHTFGLLHCKDPKCTMHYCRSIRDVDRKSEGFCRYCTIMLEDAMKKILGKG